MKATRRSLLASGALGLGLSPLVRVLGRALAAEPSSVPNAFVGIYMPHGVARELWRPRGNFQLAYADSSLAPFDDPVTYGQSFRERTLVLEGLDLTAGIRGGSAGHDGSRALFTGSAFEGKNASIDQFLAVEQQLGQSTPLASLVLGVGSAQALIASCISFAPGGTPLPKLVAPSQTYHQVIGQWQVSAEPNERAAQLAARQRGQSVLDAVRGDLTALAARAGASEQAKLDAHATALRALEKRLAGFELACSVPEPSAPPQLEPGSAPFFDAVTDLQLELLAFAFGCGLTRFATLYMADLSYTGLDPTLPTDVHEGVAHRYSASSDDGATPGDAATWLPLARQNRYCYAKVARLLQLLSAADALDSTLVVATSDMGNPAMHSSRNLPTVIVGGAQAGIRAGRYLDVRQQGTGVPNNRLLVSLARALGVELDRFGDTAPDISGGVLDLS